MERLLLVLPMPIINAQNCGIDCGNGDSNCEIQLIDKQRCTIAKLLEDGSNTAKSLARLFGYSLRSAERGINFLRKNGYIGTRYCGYAYGIKQPLVQESQPQDGTQDDTQDDTQGDTQGDTQEPNLDIWIEEQIGLHPNITTEELARLSGKGKRTIKRHISKMTHCTVPCLSTASKVTKPFLLSCIEVLPINSAYREIDFIDIFSIAGFVGGGNPEVGIFLADKFCKFMFGNGLRRVVR